MRSIIKFQCQVFMTLSLTKDFPLPLKLLTITTKLWKVIFISRKFYQQGKSVKNSKNKLQRRLIARMQ